MKLRKNVDFILKAVFMVQLIALGSLYSFEFNVLNLMILGFMLTLFIINGYLIIRFGRSDD